MTDHTSEDEPRDDAARRDDPAQPVDGVDDPSPTAVAAPAERSRRVSRWDRPPEPHDWRFYVGTVGKVLIATGLLMFGFVAYQLWGTGIETARAQSRLEDRFATLLAEHDDTSPTDTAPPGTSPTSDTTNPETSTAPAPTSTTTTTSPATDAADDADGVPVPTDLSDAAVDQDPIPEPVRGEPLLRLEIPAIGRDDIVVPGVTVSDLKSGPGHYPDTPLPGQLGNAAIAGHRTTYGAPFFDVDRLEPGDEIITTLLNGDRFVYEVTSTEVVSASDYWVVTTRDPDIAELTLTSCHPKYSARDRIVVHSVLDPEKSSNVGFPTFYELDDDGEADEIAGDDPVLSADIEVTPPDSALGDLDEPTTEDDEDTGDASSEATADDETVGDDTADDDTTDDDPRPVTDDELDEAQAAVDADDGAVDAFSQGWFDDRAAFPQVALWALALALVAVLGYQVSKRYRRWSVGILVGIAPFVIALYFFYQNVNRLLPPGI